MSFAFCLDKKDEVYSFAYSFPYSYTRLDRYLTKLESRNLDFFKRETLAFTVVSFVQLFHIQLFDCNYVNILYNKLV